VSYTRKSNFVPFGWKHSQILHATKVEERRKDNCNQTYTHTLSNTAVLLLPLLEREKLALHRDLDAIAGGVFDLVHAQGEVNGGHDAVAKLLMDDGLEWVTVHLQDLVEPVQRRICWWYAYEASTVREVVSADLVGEGGRRKAEDGGELADVIFGGFGLTVKHRGDPDLAAADVLANLLKAELLLFFGFKELCRDRELSELVHNES